MVLNTTFNNISVISWQSVLLVEETGGPRKNHRVQILGTRCQFDMFIPEHGFQSDILSFKYLLLEMFQ
jgi:hypothetical protein